MSVRIYAIERAGLRKIVAGPSWSHAAKLLEISTHMLKTHGEISQSENELSVAMADPGAVFGYIEETEQWQRLLSSKRSRLLPANGGYRPGGGKPLEGNSVAKGRCVRLMESHFDAYQALGGITWMRQQIRTSEEASTTIGILSWESSSLASLRSIRLCNEDFEKYTKLGGVRWLRWTIEVQYTLLKNRSVKVVKQKGALGG